MHGRWILIKKVTLCEFRSFASFWFWIEPCIDLIKKPRFLWRSSTKLNIFLGLGICLVTISIYFHHSYKITKLKLQTFRPSSFAYLLSDYVHWWNLVNYVFGVTWWIFEVVRMWNNMLVWLMTDYAVWFWRWT